MKRSESNYDKLYFVVIGSQKCASTWIYDCLKNHPDLNLRNSKNEDAYYGGEVYRQKGGDEWYFKQFIKNNNAPKGCVSVEYIEDVTCPGQLFKLNPNLKIIGSLRHPTQRAISAYQWYVRKAFVPDLPLEDGICELLKHFSGQTRNEYSAAYKNIIERGFYATRLKRWYTTFPPDQIKINFFDEVKQNPLRAIEEIMNFLETDDSYIPPNVHTIPKKNAGFGPLIKLERKFPTSRVISKVADLGNQLIFKQKKKPIIHKLNDVLTQQLNNVYQPSLEELDKLFSVYNKTYQKKMHEFWG